MKKYRLTKITVKTREIISLSKNSAEETHTSVCPFCRTPLSPPLHSTKSSAAAANLEKRPAELPPAKIFGSQNK